MKLGLLRAAAWRGTLAPPTDGEGGAPAVVVVANASEGGDQAGEGEAPAAEAVADAAVEIARIEGETAVQLAEIHTAADLEHHELAVEAEAAFGEAVAENINSDMEAEISQCRSRIQELETENLELRQLIPPPSLSEPPLSPPESAGEAAPLAAAESPPLEQSPPEPPKRAKPARWI